MTQIEFKEHAFNVQQKISDFTQSDERCVISKREKPLLDRYLFVK